MGTGKKLHIIGIMLWNPWPFSGSWTYIVQKKGNQIHPDFPPSALLRIPVDSRNFALLQALWVRINALTAQVMDCNIPDIQDEKTRIQLKTEYIIFTEIKQISNQLKQTLLPIAPDK